MPSKPSPEPLITDNLDIWSAAIEQKSTAGRGSSKKYSLHGIKKLRELILELAVRGKLVPQDPNDEPASALLECIAAEKAQLIKDKKIKKQKPLPEISEDEKPFELPKGWEWSRLGNLGDWGAGSTPLRGNSEFYGGGIPWFKSGELSYDYIDESEETITELAVQKTSVRYNHIGDVLVAMYGATIGKTSILSVRATTNQAVCACTPFTGFKNTYLLMLLKASKARLVGMGAGGAQPNISKEKIINTLIGLPAVAEQHRIVAKVDELMSLCDALEAQTENSISAHQTLVTTLLDALLLPTGEDSNNDSFQDNWQRISEHFDTLFTTAASIDALKQTILQLAVMGKLVPQDFRDEPASKLLERIAAEKAQLIKDKKIKKQKPLPEITEDEKPFELPKGWKWCNLGDLAVVRGGKRLPKGHVLTVEPTPYIYIRVTDMRAGSIRDNDLHYISSKARSIISNYIITTDDIYMTIVGATIGKCGLVPERFNGMNLTENAARLSPYCGVDKTFLFKCLDSSFAQNQFYDKTKQVGVQKMALNRLSSTKIPLPPLEEQHRIVAKVDELMALCDSLKARLIDAQTTQLYLADSLVKEAL